MLYWREYTKNGQAQMLCTVKIDTAESVIPGGDDVFTDNTA
jgi:hypothetical protein